ncbi:hypothetical protein J6P52_05505 [bacterium]|nr:hypothetical protein [bacterium]
MFKLIVLKAYGNTQVNVVPPDTLLVVVCELADAVLFKLVKLIISLEIALIVNQ